MSFKISSVLGQPQYDSLPVAKIIDYPLEKGAYKPFAQASLCVNEQGFIIRMWAFEAQPERESSLRAVFQLDPQHTPQTVSVEIFPDRRTRLLVEEREWDPAAVHVHHFTGEDLQGLYWGATVLMPHAFLTELFPQCSLESGRVLRGNLYKLCSGERPHSGSFTPVDFTKNPFAPDQLGEFAIVLF